MFTALQFLNATSHVCRYQRRARIIGEIKGGKPKAHEHDCKLNSSLLLIQTKRRSVRIRDRKDLNSCNISLAA